MATVTWFGSMAYNKLKIQKFKGSDVIYCPICKIEISKEEWYVLNWMGLKDPPAGEFGECDQWDGKNYDTLAGFRLAHSLTMWSGFY
jgi:hypothetical protein